MSQLARRKAKPMVNKIENFMGGHFSLRAMMPMLIPWKIAHSV
jgi:hypothetical protein